jgi:diguanylate cyclase (GGDEF)-like protein
MIGAKVQKLLSRLRLTRRPDSVTLVAAGMALIVGGVALTSFELWSLKNALEADLRVQAQIVGDNAQAAIAFGDKKTGTEILSALHASPTVVAATLYDQQGGVFATYEQHAGDEKVSRESAPSFFSARIEVWHTIEFGGVALGMVRVSGALSSVYKRLAEFVLASVLTGIVGLSVAYLLMSKTRKAVRRAEERLNYLAHYDPVTNLLNRHAFNERLDFALQRAERFKSQVALLLLDLDHFKAVNDRLGHQAGDVLLQTIGARLTKLLRRSDSVCRLGGDEFAVILEHIAQRDEAALVAGKIVQQVAEAIEIGGQEVFPSASCGVALFPLDAANANVLVRCADSALYVAKEAGRDRYQMYREEMNLKAQRREVIETGLRQSLDGEGLTPLFQPKVNVQTGTVVGAEALVRWEHPQLGKLTPSEFIPIAEESNLIIGLGNWVMREACLQGRRWEREGVGPIPISVNLSARQFKSDQLLSQMLACLRESGLAPQLLELELTETILMENVEANIRLLQQLRTHGVRLSVDDFGTGYSSMNYLKRLPVDALKIDRAFVKGLPGGAEDAAIVKAIIGLAHTLGLEVVAEGAETREQQQFLQANRCDTVQGYFYSQPLTAMQFAQWLRESGMSVSSAPHRTRRAPELALAAQNV